MNSISVVVARINDEGEAESCIFDADFSYGKEYSHKVDLCLWLDETAKSLEDAMAADLGRELLYYGHARIVNYVRNAADFVSKHPYGRFIASSEVDMSGNYRLTISTDDGHSHFFRHHDGTKPRNFIERFLEWIWKI